MASPGQGFQASDNQDWLGARWSKYYPSTGQFQLNNRPSGAEGAVARGVFALDNYPNVAVGLRCNITYRLPDGYVAANPAAFNGLDNAVYECRLRLSLAQQNITANEGVHLKAVIGWPNSAAVMPFPMPTLFRGSNNVNWELTRLIAVPVVDQDFAIIPTVHMTLVVVVVNADYMPGGSPGSSGRP